MYLIEQLGWGSIYRFAQPMEIAMAASPTELPVVQPATAIAGNERAPFIYFDGITAFGTQNGAIQIELAARTMVPAPDGVNIQNEFVATAHLRCSPAAAANLREALEKALEMLNQAMQGQQQPPEPARGRMN
jgi:hypothetical protein